MVHLTLVVPVIVHYLLVHVAVAQDTAMLKAIFSNVRITVVSTAGALEEEKQGYSGALSLLECQIN